MTNPIFYWQDLKDQQSLLSIYGSKGYVYQAFKIRQRFKTKKVKVIYLPFLFIAGDKDYPEDDDQLYYPVIV